MQSSNASSRCSARSQVAYWIGTFAVVLLATVPFLSKPLHIDDAADLQYVQQVLRSPLDPYGFEVDWDEGPRPAFQNYHPPLKYYYHALVLALFPFSEITLHLSYVPFVALTAWAVQRLAARFGCPPLLVLVTWMLGPGYLPGQNAMLDVPVMALGLAATALFIEAVDGNRLPRLLAAGTILGAALLTKYSAIIYAPVWMLYLAVHGRFRHWTCFLAPSVMFIAWCLGSSWRYGSMHPLILFQGMPVQGTVPDIGQKLLTGVVYLGGALALAPVLLGVSGRRGRNVVLLAAVALVILAFLATPTRRVVGGSPYLTSTNFAWWCFLAWGGLGVALLGIESLREFGTREAALDAVRSRSSADRFLVAAWFLIAFGMGSLMSPFLAMRRIVEASLPACMLLLSPAGQANALRRTVTRIAVTLHCTMGVLVAAADYEFAACYARFASDMGDVVQRKQSRVYCHGYWGWSHYTRAAGLQHIVLGRERLPDASVLVIPEEVAKPATLPDGIRSAARKKHEESIRGRIPIRVMNHWAGAGYYGAAWGPLPYGWSTMPVEVFSFYEIDRAAEK
jgi:hypothetical protein